MEEDGNQIREVVVRAPINIALIKYWGKTNKELIIPANDSISITIDELYAETTVTLTDSGNDRVVINGDEIDLGKQKRFRVVIKEFRRLINRQSEGPPFLSISSQTNFATSAGLASSAAGFGAIAFGLTKLGKLKESEMIRLARLGSGSACRSVLPGFVHWRVVNEGETSCETLAGSSAWTSLRAVVFELSDRVKDVSSTIGMQRTLETSTLFDYRIRVVVPDRIQRYVRFSVHFIVMLRLKEAIASFDFNQLAEITMADSNQLHAVCLDSNPPLRYLSDESWRLIRFVEIFNGNDRKAAYTFDAGPNCCVFVQTANLPNFLNEFARHFGFTSLPTDLLGLWTPKEDGTLKLKKLIVSSVGSAPQIVNR
ncbi:Diphosphomevalonate decarboxylase [Aphelenchoides besseyi]|nr:Diphosphomevalonate decarboxylase [Aphelenchoides besseyi]